MAHEDFNRNETVQRSSERGFGIVFATVFLIIALLPLFSQGHVRSWSLVVSVAFLLAAFLLPGLLAPLNRGWARFGLLLHHIVSPFVLGIMYFGVITPMGLVMRALRKDPLRLRRDITAPTYWVRRTPPGPARDSFKHQF